MEGIRVAGEWLGCPRRGRWNNPKPVADDPYLMLAEGWAESKWRRAACAHGRGDDHLSLIDLRELAALDKAVAKACQKRGIKAG